MKPLMNAILFQVVWFICLLAGSTWALVATLIYLILHDRYFMQTRKEWRLLFVFFALGLVIDGSLFQIGVFSTNAEELKGFNTPPVWLICLWVSVGTLFAHSLAFLRSRYLFSALLGAVGPTMSYFAGANLAGIRLAEPLMLSLFIVALIWSMVLLLGVWLCEKWALFPEEGE
ncbi:DUF2878 domain-containing protein [Marinomonas rhizomae]|uniref:Uncharacterized protein DUF2878 n=1 Tax=Marinomonas rhizomae TaxID=491948 RepID=A0A366IXC3_9GAMM|nr:DUF2878 domain-containing protein [Marinomonas rhizomae]RBP79466.1 uncharacterized protein DUF2878 [Marinomonas rhizomae]RNF71389.1 DUF2878 domain-containing protein [Marinomonas rhizomae]